MTKRTVFTSCIKAGPLAVTRVGSNPGAHALITRTAKPADRTPPKPATEEDSDMDPKAIARVAAAMAVWTDVTRAHFAALDEDGQVAFLERTAAEQVAEAAEAKRKVDEAASAEAARKAGVSEGELELQRKLDEKDARIAALEAKDVERGYREIARSKDFDGFPGGEDALVTRMQSIAGLPQEQQDVLRADWKAQAAMAKRTAEIFGDPKIVDIARAAKPATTKVQDEIKRRVAATPGLDSNVALANLTREPEWRADLDAMQEEEAA